MSETYQTEAKTPKKILVIRYGAMGDLVHAASAVQELKKQYPDLKVDWLTTPFHAPLLNAFVDPNDSRKALIEQVIPYDKTLGLTEFIRIVSLVKNQQYDAIVNLHPSLKTYIISWLSGDSKTAVYHKEKLSVQGKAQRGMARRHAVEDFLQPFLQLFDLSNSKELTRNLPPSLNLAGIADTGISNENGLVCLIVGVGQKRGNRGWPIQNYAALCKLVLEHTQSRVALIGGPDEVALGEKILATLPNERRLHNTCGQLSLLETARLLESASVVVGGDTGPLHLASCFNVPVIGIFGPTSIQRTGALGPDSLRQHFTPHDDLDCWPCELPSCPLTGEDHLACMRQTLPEQIYDQVKLCLNESRLLEPKQRRTLP